MHHVPDELTSRLPMVAAALLLLFVVVAVALVALSAARGWVRVVAGVATVLVLVQSLHSLEHVLQLKHWFEHPYAPGMMTMPAQVLASGFAALADRASITGQGMGMELLHLTGNVLFMACAIAIHRWRPSAVSRALLVFEGAHLAEHLMLTFTAALGGPSWGASTLFARLSGPELSSYRVWWHFLMNATGMLLALWAISARNRAAYPSRRGALALMGVALALNVVPLVATATTPYEPGFPAAGTSLADPVAWMLLTLTPLTALMGFYAYLAIRHSAGSPYEKSSPTPVHTETDEPHLGSEQELALARTEARAHERA